MGKKKPRNRLSDEKSPYLQQHADNPVDWYPWGNEAFEKARREEKPVFLSIGYSTCHWCHVMEQESFEDDDIARLLNEHFVSIKVDREERPDIDSYYMTVCQILTGTGGWPLTIFTRPDRKPFFAATYVPKESKYGRAGLMQLLPKIASAWQHQQDDILKSTEEISEYVTKLQFDKGNGKLDSAIIDEAYHALRDAYDPETGGFGNAPKFPAPQNILFLLRHHMDSGHGESLEMVEHTLREMRMGSIYDHLGFGFHRYSTDPHWRIPHFEKMLYDQALMIIAYCEAFQVTRNILYRETALEIIEYVLRDMQAQEGVFYSAEDADCEGQEGKYYQWTESEMKEILTPEEYTIAAKAYNIQNDGNFEDEISRAYSGRNLLYRTLSHETLAQEFALSVEELKAQMYVIRQKLFAQRNERIPPHKDKKALCDWNGLMIAALSKAARVFGDARSRDEAKRAADFILTTMRTTDGFLYHRFIDGEAAINGFLDDYAFMIWALIELYQVDFAPHYLKTAIELNDTCFTLFWDREKGAFFSTPAKSELPIRKKEVHDGAIPSGNSIAAQNLIRLARLIGRHELEEEAIMIFDAFGEHVQRNTLAHISMLQTFRQILSPAPNIVISGDGHTDKTSDMVHLINNSRRLDIDTLMLPIAKEAETADMEEFTRDLKPIDGRTTAYVCNGYECARPTTDTTELSQLIDPRAAKTGG